MSSKIKHVLLLLVSALYLAGWGYAATLTSFWFDEEYTIDLVEHSWRGMFHMLRGDWAPPLFFIVLKPWHAMTAFMGPEFSMRSFSLVSGLAAMWVWLNVFEKLAPDSYAPCAAFALMAVSPFLGWYATEARYYQFYILVAGLAWLSLQHLTSQPFSWRWRVLTGLFCAAVPMTHITGIVGATAFVIWLAFGWWKKELSRAQTQAALWAMLFAVIFFLPQLDTLNNQVGRIKSFWAAAPSWNIFQDLGGMIQIYFFSDMGKGGWLEALWLGCAVAAFVWSLIMAPWPMRRMLFAAWGGFFLAFWAGSHMTLPFLIPRVTLPWVPLLFLAVAVGVERFGGRLALGAMVLTLLIISAPIARKQHLGAGREDARGAVKHIKANALPGDQVVTVSTLGDYYLTRAGLKFSLEGDKAGPRFWLIRRKSEKLDSLKPWARPEGHPKLFKVLTRKDFESSVDPYWTLELLLAEPIGKKMAAY